MPSAVVKRNSTDISSTVDWASLSVAMVLTKEVSTATFTVKIPVGNSTSSLPVVGDQIDIYDQSSNHIFAGTVTESELTTQGFVRNYAITCTDWSYLMDGKLVVATYANEDPADIVIAILTSFCSGGGFTHNNVQRGNFLVPSIKFNYQQPTKAIEALAKLIGWEWYIDSAKDVHFFLTESGVAPFNIDDTSGNTLWETLDIDINTQNMKNSIFVIGASKITTLNAGTTPDVYQTDGVRSTFGLAYKYTQATITVTLAGTVQTIGIVNQSTGGSYQVLYDPTNQNIQFQSVPTTGQTVKIYGTAPVPIIAHAQDYASIATYGEKQNSIVDKKITTEQEAALRAQADILQFGHPVYDVKFRTRTTGCTIGQAITLNSVKLGITNYPLVIKRIDVSGYTPNNLIFDVQAIGSDNVTFNDIMATLLQQQQQDSNTDNTVLDYFVSVNESIAVGETVLATGESPPYTWG